MPAQQPSDLDQLRIEMVDAGGQAAQRIAILSQEFAEAGHDVFVRRPAGPPAPSTLDVVHAHGWEAVEAVGVPESGALIASLTEPAGGLNPGTVGLGRAYDRILAPSSDSARRLVGLGLRRERIGVVPDGVDTAVFSAGPGGPKLQSGQRSYRIVCVRPTLAPDLLIDAMAALRRVPDAQLYVAGGPPPSAIRRDPAARQIAGLAQRIGVANRVLLVGDVPEEHRPQLYRTADAVMCTGEPGADRIALEAMACAVPVAAFAEGGVADIITHGLSGILVEPGNTHALGDAVRGLLASEPRRYAYAVAGLSRVQERFTWPKVAEQIEAYYRAAIAERQGARL